MPDLRLLRERRATASDIITQLADTVTRERRDLTAEEQSQWDRANADYDRLGREIEVEERAQAIANQQGQRAGDPDVGRDDHNRRADTVGRRGLRAEVSEEQRTHALRAWASAGVRPGQMSREQSEACRSLRVNPSSATLDLDLWSDRHLRDVQREWRNSDNVGRQNLMLREERANLSAQIPQAGGYLVAPGTLASAFEMNLLAFGGALDVAEIVTTESGEPYIIPTVDDTANVGALMGENTQAMSTGVNPSLAQKRMDAYKFTSTPVLVPTELLEDDQYDLAGQLGEMLGTRLGRGQAPYFATGTGASQPQGIVTGSSAGITTAGATAITFDELVKLEHAIDPTYRKMPGVAWLMHDSIKSYIRRIKDGNGRPLWISGENYQSAATNGAPEKLLTYTVNVCQEMAAATTSTGLPATGTISVLFGVLPKFKVRRVRGVRLYRLTERFRDLDQDGFVAFQRLDSRVIDSGTPPIKRMTQA